MKIRKLISFILLITMLMTTFSTTANALSGGTSRSEDTVIAHIKSGTYDYEKALEVVELTNEHRINNDLEPLEVDPELMEYAMERAKEIAIYFSHTRVSTGNSATDDVNGGNITFSAPARDAEGIFMAWKNSTGHNENMLIGAFHSIGIGCFRVGSCEYSVQVFNVSGASGTNTKTGIENVTNEPVVLNSTKGYIQPEIIGLDTSLKVGEKTAPSRVSLSDTGVVEILPSDLKWESSDTSVFTVDESGNVTAVGEGNATLTVSLGDFNDEYNIDVSRVPVTGIELDEEDEKITINIGDSKQLIPTVFPEDATNKEIKWSTSDDKIATVSEDGIITGVAEGGPVEITATTVDGNYSVTCEVTVKCGHKNKTTHEAIESTCLTQGNNEYITCDDCGRLIEGSDEKLPLGDHEYGKLIEKKEPVHTSTTLEEGMEAHYECSVCGKLFDENKNETTEDELIIPAPVHEYGDYLADTEYHWKSCGCGNIVEREQHTGGEASCTQKAQCEVCNLYYGEVDSNNHKNTEIRNEKDPTCSEEGYTGDTYCADCDTLLEEGEAIEKVPHSGGEATCSDKAICEMCGQEYGELNSENHKNTEIRNEKDPTCSEEGYTGDTYCADCDTLLEEGEAIEKVPHSGGEATCSNKALCEMCNQEYGELDADNHKNVVTENEKEATCEDAGYTGDKVCKDCGVTLETGKEIQAKGHTGGEATCTNKAVCEVCGKEYGELDADNHKNTEFRDSVQATEESEGYTGDLYCSDCGVLIKEGEVIPVVVPEEKPNTGNVDSEETEDKEEKVEDEDYTDKERPDTSDNSNLALWISLLIISGISFVVIARCKTIRKTGKHIK